MAPPRRLEQQGGGQQIVQTASQVGRQVQEEGSAVEGEGSDEQKMGVLEKAGQTEVEQLPGWRSIVNPDDPLFLNPPSMTEAIRSYCRQMDQPEPLTVPEMARCIFDSLARSYRSVMEGLESLRQRKLLKIRIIGGGCKNRLINQLCADACGLTVAAGPVEASVLGNLSAQMIALGTLQSLDAARALVRASSRIEEYEPQAAVPDKIYQQFQQFLKTKYKEE